MDFEKIAEKKKARHIDGNHLIIHAGINDGFSCFFTFVKGRLLIGFDC